MGEGLDFLRVLSAPGKYDDWSLQPISQFDQHFLAIHIGQPQVQNDQIGPAMRSQLQPLLTGTGFLDAELCSA